MIRVTRVIEITTCGTILNPLASHSQETSGVVRGVGVALEKATEVDHRIGRIMNASLRHYHVPVDADIHSIEVGIPAAIANAVYHATGRRIRTLPITPEKLL